jgi:hypothetical protein
LRSGWMVETLWVTVAMGEPQERFGPDGEIGVRARFCFRVRANEIGL